MLTRRQIVGNLAYKDNLEKKRKQITKEEDLEKKRKDILKSINENKRKDIIKKVSFIAISFGVSFFVVFRSDKLFSMQSSLNEVNDQINMYQKSNDSLNIEILMQNDLNKIESIAIEKLNMTDVDISSKKIINNVNDYFDAQPVKKAGLFDIIKDFFQKF